MIYKAGLFGKTELSFNDPVEVTFTFLPKEETIGRLVQVRKKCGAWGSDVLFIRLPSGKLRTFENVGIQPYKGKELPFYEGDSIEETYTIMEQYPETGFIIETPKQPESYSPPFAITVTKE